MSRFSFTFRCSWLMKRAVLLIMILHSATCFCQVLPFHVYTARDGLTRNDVRSLCQDPTGFLWFGTSEGLNRYDGATFDRFELPGGLRGNFINEIVVDSSVTVWIASNFSGVSRFANGRFETFAVDVSDPLSRENRVNTLVPLATGALLIGTDAGLFRFSSGSITRLFPSDSLLLKGVECVLVLADGSCLIGTYDGLFFGDGGFAKDPIHVEGFDGIDVRRMVQDREGKIWLATDRGLKVVCPQPVPSMAPTLCRLPSPLQVLGSESIRSLLLDSRGSLWVGTEARGALKYSAEGTLASYSLANGLPANMVRAILEDHEHDLWFATTGGVAKETGDQLSNYLFTSGVPNSPVMAIAQDGQNRFWFGTAVGLAKLSEGRFSHYSKTNGLASDYILCLSVDLRGGLWVGTAGGLNRLQTSSAGDHFFGCGKQGVLVRSLLPDDPSGLWVGLDDGIALLRTDGWFEFPFKVNRRKSTLAVCILRDLSGSLWVGTEGDGIYRFAVDERPADSPSLREIAHYSADSALVDENIRSGFVDGDGHLWFGTRFGGVTRFLMRGPEVVSIEVLDASRGLSGDWVRQILQSGSGDLWFATNRGVDRLTRDPAGKRHIRSFTIRDGLAGDEAFALHEDADGNIWFGATSGVTRYSPATERPDAFPPPVLIRKIQILGNEDTTSVRTLSADLASHQHTLAFEFVGISLRDESGVRYRYMLEGLDTSWSAETDRRYANYTHLPPGRYAFKVSARNAAGEWSISPAVFRFTIASPFWQTWWFILLALIGVAATLSSMHLFRVRKLLELERVRTRIAADLHDDLGSTLGSISVFSEMARREAATTSPRAADYLVRIGESSRMLLGSLDDIVWAINPGNDGLDSVILRIQEFASPVLEAKGIHFSLNVPHDIGRFRLPMEIRRQFYLLCKEALANIARHSHASHSSLTITVADSLLSLTVRDNGVGLSGNHRADGNGLRNMRARAKTLGAVMQVDRNNGSGTAILLTFRINGK
jgi:ligand-binding sensor domain-containing protein/signal transduction histidine kinase